MDVDFIGSEVLDEEAFEFQENHDFPLPEVDGERCGICMDIIIDMGVLDCCQHWFCFGCIDDWATITNLCPLCQNVFQSITCVPVYDTIGGSAADDDSFSGDDDWSIEGTSGIRSMPSYYIDENAVTCLDGDCRVRSGSATIGEDCNLETSIACDSCDLWFHAACVGFVPEGSSEDTWLCPRCSKSDSTLIQRPNGNCAADTLLSTCLNEAALCGKMSVSVADAGETALVVSMIEADRPKTTEQTDLISKGKGSGMSSSNDAYLNHELSCCMVHTGSNETKNEESSWGGSGTSLGRLSKELHEQDNQSGRGPGFGLFSSSSPADHLIDETVQCNDNKEGVGNSGSKRKHAEFSDNSLGTLDEGANSENVGLALKKKIRGSEELQPASSVDQLSAPRPGDSRKCLSPVDITKDLNCKQALGKEDVCDVMSIVKGAGRRPFGRRDSRMPGKPAKETENKAGLRVKKIIRRASDNKESAFVVQKLRKEIRDAVRNKSSSDFGEHLFDPELLSAFRAAIAGSTTEPRNLPHTAFKMKKSLMQKGKVRENLTKKIYADSNGRRKRAWDRDCEVEFWKHRCMRTTKPEKIATLNSVLNLLKKDAGGTEKDAASGSQERNPILSRLYLADTSVFPRKDNIKLLAAIETTSNSEQSGALASVGESQKSSSDGQGSKSREVNKILTKNNIISADDKGVKEKILSSKNSNQSSKAHPEKSFRASQASSLGGPKSNLSKETVTMSGDRKIDKRKWALEVLARKMAVVGKSGEHEKQEDNADLKGNFPLLAQLPRDMRPELVPSRHKKIPISIRQKQLYRLTEHFLKKLNLSEMRRIAKTELAVADAINIEKEVADRSNSKQGYLNLCSHEILRRSDGKNSLPAKKPCSEAESTKSSVSEQPCEDTTDPDILDALRNAGLLPDSPPSTPNGLPTEADEAKFQGEGANNVFEIDANADVDIYGDFEYDLEDEDYIGATSVKVSKQPVEDGGSKMKVVLTTLKCDVLINTENSSCTQKFEQMETPHVPPLLQENQSDVGITRSTTEVNVTEDLHREESEEPSLAECEELYGPDKEPMIDKLPSEILCRQSDSEVPAENAIHGGNPNLVSGRADGKDVPACHECNGDTAAGHLQASEGVSGKEKSILDLSKQNDINSVSKKVEAYIKEHIRPLCKSGIITAEQYRWAVAKTTDKVMKFHSNSKNANFLIKEGEKVKKLAEKYVEAAQQKGDK